MIFIFKKQNKKNIKGFTLVETLVSIMIITTVILGPLTVAMGASAYAKQTKDTMTALYLAQESLELLHHQQDSIFVRCLSNSSSNCPVQIGETPSEAAWRIFNTRLGTNAQGVSCFSVDTPGGCAYDFIDMTSNEDLNPPKYSFSDNQCPTLSISPQGYYVCSLAHGSGFLSTLFSRTVSITSIPTINGTDANYNNDLRATVTVSFKRTNGYTKQIKIVDFFHAHA
jgi:type II secretory pathway pseudopilin PulG